MVIDKEYAYRGIIVVKLINNTLTFYQKVFNKIGIFFEIIKKKDGRSEKLFLDIEQASMTLKKKDCYGKLEEILELSLGRCLLYPNMLTKMDDHVDNTFQVFEKYHLRAACGMLAEVEFVNDDVALFSVIGNPDTTLLCAYQWACSVWPTISGYEDPIMHVGDVVVSEVTFSLKKAPKVGVSERCHVTPVTEDDETVTVPWSSSVSRMAAFLAEVLKVECDMIRLCGPDKQVLNEGVSLDKDNFRGSGEHLNLFYDVEGAQVRCESMEGDEVFVTVLGDPTAEKVKERLSFKIKVEKSRLMVYQRLNKVKSVIRGCNEVSKEEPLGYCVGLSIDTLKVGDELGHGGYGHVFCSREIESGITIALKRFRDLDDDISCSILREYRAMFKVPPHDNIIGYRGIYVDNDRISIGMELAPLKSLKDYIDNGLKTKDPPLEESEVWFLATGILHGLNHLHSNGIFHRDLKPDNVLLGANKVPKLCDFGLSKILTDLTKKNTNGFRDFTHSDCRGTYRYMAPEVIKVEENSYRYSFKADVWSFGATMVHMTTGRRPYHDFEEPLVINKIGDSESIEWTLPNRFSNHIKDFIDLCLKPKGEDRPTGTELLPHIQKT